MYIEIIIKVAWCLKMDKIKGTAHNRTVYASPPVGGSASAVACCLRLGQSLRSFPRHCSGTFGRHETLLPAGFFIVPPKRRKQPERYAQCLLFTIILLL
ncbi:hypothetical protein Holit_02224 [Hollandina sp. SP2]